MNESHRRSDRVRGQALATPAMKRISAKREQFRLCLERLESRYLLAGDSWRWFETFDEVPRLSLSELSPAPRAADEIGPHDLVASEWIVQLNEGASRSSTLSRWNGELDQAHVDFSVISGLGSPGLLLMRGRSVDVADIEQVLSSSDSVEHFSLNSVVAAQQTPNDPEYQGGLLPGLDQIEASAAWDESIGSMDIVVGVVDGGIDATHPDLFLNIWLNQGEIPDTFRDQLVDVDGDNLITFYDLNNLKRDGGEIVVASTGVAATVAEMTTATPFASGDNAEFVEDKNNNGRIDAVDLLEDVTWADGFDTDGNSFFDDFFGVNFRSGANDSLPSNRPLDLRGHGTHVAGTIGAVGNNGMGVAGVNWQTSLMSLRILDNDNQTDSASALRAMNYAREMRSALQTDGDGRTTGGADLRVLNNSWGQPGGFQAVVENAIKQLDESEILFVAAAGNGNFIGLGVDNDATPFYPANYDVGNVVSVAAWSSADRLAGFSNYGDVSVDLAAPGVGVRSTVPGGGYGSANGTSMAAPHVAGAAALLWSVLPEVPLDEVVAALGKSVTEFPSLSGVTSNGGVLNVAAAINADVFAPTARLLAAATITDRSSETHDLTIEFEHRSGIDIDTIGDDDIEAVRTWGPSDPVTLRYVDGSAVVDGLTLTATYTVEAPGGEWDPFDFGTYEIRTRFAGVGSVSGNPMEARQLGSFDVRVEEAGVFYVDTLADDGSADSLRGTVAAANAIAPAPATIILDSGVHVLTTASVEDPASPFLDVAEISGCIADRGSAFWSDHDRGDLDVLGDVTIVGGSAADTVLSASNLSRLFKVHENASLGLRRLTLTDGRSPAGQGGGAILSRGSVSLEESILVGNVADTGTEEVGGGGIASWGGTVTASNSTLSGNEADVGSAVFACDHAQVSIVQSTIDHNTSRREEGGAVYSLTSAEASIENTTISGNVNGAIRSSIDDSLFGTDVPSINLIAAGSIGSKFAFSGFGDSFSAGEVDGTNTVGYVFDTETGSIEPMTTVIDGVETRVQISSNPHTASGGRFAVVRILNQPELTNFGSPFALWDFQSGELQLTPLPVTGGDFAHVSDDGRMIAIRATNPVPADTNGFHDVYIYDRVSEETTIVDFTLSGDEISYASRPAAISGDGSTVAIWMSVSDGNPNNGQQRLYVVSSDGTDLRLVAEGRSGFSSFDANSGKLTEDGSKLVFATSVALVPEDTDSTWDVYVYNIALDTYTLVTITPEGVHGDGTSAIISVDGERVAFLSTSSVFDENDVVGSQDVFVKEMSTGNIRRLILESELLADRPWFTSRFDVVSFVGDDSLLFYAPPRFVESGQPGAYFTYDLLTDEIEAVLPTWRGGTASVTNATIAHNVGLDVVHGFVEIKNSVLANNQSPLIGFDPTELGSRSRSLGYNVFESASSATEATDIVAFNSTTLIGPLENEDSITRFHPLLEGHPAIDSGNPSDSPSVDQRGIERNSGLPDRGAVEQDYGKLSGEVFLDLNLNGIRDPDEPGIAGVTLLTESLGSDGEVSFSERTTAIADDLSTQQISELGRFQFQAVPTGTASVSVLPPENFVASIAPTIRIKNPLVSNNGKLYLPDLSADGRYVAFRSYATNLVPGGSVGLVYDRITGTIESVGADSLVIDDKAVSFASRSGFELFVHDRQQGVTSEVFQSNPSVGFVNPPVISADGNHVLFQEGHVDLMIYSNSTGDVEQVNVTADGTRFDIAGYRHAISGDGRYVAFVAQQGIPGVDVQVHRTLYVMDRVSHAFELIAVSPNIYNFSMSDDARYVAYTNSLHGLQVELFDRWTGLSHSVTTGVDGQPGNGASYATSLNRDGRFLMFESAASNLVEGDDNDLPDWFVYDTATKELRLVASAGVDPSPNRLPTGSGSISADGKFLAFESDATDIVDGDTEGLGDIFIVENPFLEGITPIDLEAGETAQLDFGISPLPGSISGRLFEDSIANGIYDSGERVFSGQTVYLDANGNGIREGGEEAVTTDPNGEFLFQSLPGFQSHSIGVMPPPGREQISPFSEGSFSWNLFLPAGGEITGRDFAFRRVVSTGQSTNSSVSGRIFTDTNGNGSYDEGVDVPVTDVVLYADAINFGTRDEDEPAVEADSSGAYTISNLGASVVSVSTLFSDEYVHVTPLGNQFSTATTPLHVGVQPFGNPQSIVSADFSGDGYPDIAVALGEANKVSLRINDGQGGFLPDEIDIDLGVDGGGPTALGVAQFNGASTPMDLAVANNFTGKVIVLRDFNGTGFASTTAYPVGEEPTDLVVAEITGDSAHQDLAVVNKADNTINVLLNDGSGGFNVGAAIDTAGVDSVAIVAGEFSRDDHLDFAVVHASPLSPTNPRGDIRVLAGDGLGGFSPTSQRYLVGALPFDVVAANFDGDPDGYTDLAVNNFGSNSITLLTGRENGSFRAQSQRLGTSSGALDLGAADMDNDGDVDLIATNLLDRNISLFRNVSESPGITKFQPLESVALGQHALAQRMPFTIANFDQDDSAPGGAGTLDIIAIPTLSEELHVLTSTLVDGAHRVEVNGSNSLVGLDFIVESPVIPPTLDLIDDPLPILEGAGEQTVALGGIAKGRADGPPLQITAESSDAGWIANPTVTHVAGESSASLAFTPSEHGNGTAVITVTVTDAGANQTFGDSDDGIVRQSFTVTVQPVNDPPEFDLQPLVAVTQKAGATAIDGFAGIVSRGGGADEETQQLGDFIVAAGDLTLFSVLPAIDRQGRLAFTPDPNRSGVTLVSVSLSDDGGTERGGIDTTTKSFVINVTAVNDAPSITLGGDVLVGPGAGAQTVAAFASGFDPGPGDDDASQVITDFVVTVDRTDLFSVSPDIVNDGTLTFTPGDSTGTATVTVQVRDGGGIADGGVDLSAPQTFTITVANAPQVESVVINDGSAGRSQVTSLTVNFSGEVDHALLADAFKLTNIDTNEDVGTIGVAASDIGGKTSAILTFSGTSTVARGAGNSLANGNYRLDIESENVTTPGGALSMADDYQFGGHTRSDANNDDFFRMFGDVDGDGDVDGLDYAALGTTFLRQSGDASFDGALDNDGDGDVDGTDYAAFGEQFLRQRR